MVNLQNLSHLAEPKKEPPKKVATPKIDLSFFKKSTVNRINSTKDITDQEYFNIPAYNASLIKLYLDHPHLALLKIKGDDYHEGSKPFMIGTIVHKVVLEGHDLDKYKSLLTPKEAEHIKEMISNLLKNKFVCNILKDYQFKEKVLVWQQAVGGKTMLPCKAKIDFLTKQGFLFDLKTCVKLEDIKKNIDKYRYDLQLSFYCQACLESGIDVNAVGILAMEKSYPFESHFFNLSQELMDRGKHGVETPSGKWYYGWKMALEELHFRPKKRFEEDVTLL